ncbi:MAG: hypothetical protein WCT20_02610 [Candidatus Babeliales bacterium]
MKNTLSFFIFLIFLGGCASPTLHGAFTRQKSSDNYLIESIINCTTAPISIHFSTIPFDLTIEPGKTCKVGNYCELTKYKQAIGLLKDNKLYSPTKPEIEVRINDEVSLIFFIGTLALFNEESYNGIWLVNIRNARYEENRGFSCEVKELRNFSNSIDGDCTISKICEVSSDADGQNVLQEKFCLTATLSVKAITSTLSRTRSYSSPQHTTTQLKAFNQDLSASTTNF